MGMATTDASLSILPPVVVFVTSRSLSRLALLVSCQLQAKLQLYRSADAEYQAIVHEFHALVLSMDEKQSWLRSLDL